MLPAAGVVAATALAGAAGGQNAPPTPSSSAVSQYTELVPTSKGPAAPGLQQAQAASLSPNARAALDGIAPAAAKALATIATASDYGAPMTKSKTSSIGFEGSSGGSSLDRTFEAAATAASPISDADLIFLLVTLLVVTAGGAGLAIQARRT